MAGNTKTNRRTAPAAASTDAPAPKGKRVDAKEIQITALIDGVKAVKALHATRGFSKETLSTAAETLSSKKSSEDMGRELTELLHELFPASTGVRGRVAVEMGETRTYKNMVLIEDGEVASAAVRIPTDLYPGVVGWETTFEKGEIRLVAKKS